MFQVSSFKLQEKGFTLIELIIYFAIISVISFISVDVLYSISDSRGRIESRSEVNQNLRFAAERLINDIHLSTAVTTPSATNTSGNVLVITLPTEGSVSYSVSAGVLQRNSVNITSNNVTVAVSPDIFTRIDNGGNKTIQINLGISYNDAGRQNWQYSSGIQTTAAAK